jgi:hypothetical protein
METNHDKQKDDQSNLQDYYKQLIEKKNDLFKIQTLKQLETQEEQIQEFQSLEINLAQVIEYFENCIKLK